ncbi:hypothetical protein [Maritalea sp.]|uniref:hypothetical protein n=1 Tax=Maritalea sp. TaxID=2003361 RepID=UPI003EF761F5
MAVVEINRFEQEDVKIWGFIAVCSLTTMIVLSSVASFLPSGFLNGLRETRQNSGTINQLQSELTAVRLEFATMRRESQITGTRITLGEESGTKFSRRVRALESSIPMLLEALPADANIDRSLITASINEANGEEIIHMAENVKVSRSDLFDGRPLVEEAPATFQQQALPEPIDDEMDVPVQDTPPKLQLSSTEFGLLIGRDINPDNASLVWEQYKTKIGTLLLGLTPRALSLTSDSEKARIIAGPISNMSEAISLCLQISKAGISCETSGFGGIELN